MTQAILRPLPERAPATALDGANAKFQRRYGYILQHLRELPPRGDPTRLERMEALWQRAKTLENKK